MPHIHCIFAPPDAQKLGAVLDITVTLTDDGDTWTLMDLLGRSMGCITKTSDKNFTIRPEGHVLETMAAIKLGPFASLDEALAEIERHTRGVCRLNPGADQP